MPWYLFLLISSFSVFPILSGFGQSSSKIPHISVEILQKNISVEGITKAQVLVKGLNDSLFNEFPNLNLKLSILNPEIARIGGNSEEIAYYIIPIERDSVSAEGLFYSTIEIVGHQEGEYVLEAQVIPADEEIVFVPVFPQEAPCCEIRISWHTYKDSKLDKKGKNYKVKARAKLIKKLEKIKENFEKHDICITWFEGDPIDEGKRKTKRFYLYSYGDEQPNLEKYDKDKKFANANKPEVILVDVLQSWDAGQKKYVGKLGVTPYPGADVAAVEYKGVAKDRERIQNELYHIFGLNDIEMGAAGAGSKHTVTDDMWDFIYKVCTEGRTNPKKKKLIEERSKK